MIKIGVQLPNGRRAVLLCLEQGNVERMRAGQDIVFRGEDVHIPGVEFMIIVAEDKDALLKRLGDEYGLELPSPSQETP